MKKFQVEVEIEMKDEVEPKILQMAIEPENQTMPEGEVVTMIADETVITKINGVMGIGRLINTIDDIIKTAILAKNVSETTK